jgi:hypothetical protein
VSGEVNKMAMKLGVQTTILLIGSNDVTIADYRSGFSPTTGDWIGGGTKPTEDQYIDIGFVTDEREELTLGGLAYSTPGTGVQDRIFWAVGGKVLRVTISGIIPDGMYKGTYDDTITEGMSNSSVFRYKVNKFISYQDLTDNVIYIHMIGYERKYLKETGITTSTSLANIICRWVMTGYSLSFIGGSRNLSYSITLDQAGNINNQLYSGIKPRQFGDM